MITTGKPGPTILVVGDSFTASFFPPLLAQHVGRAIWVHYNNEGCSFDWSLVDKYHPDEVWWAPVERALLCASPSRAWRDPKRALERFAFGRSRVSLLLGRGPRRSVRLIGLGFLGRGPLAAKTLVYEGWKSLDFLGFSRPKSRLINRLRWIFAGRKFRAPSARRSAAPEGA